MRTESGRTKMKISTRLSLYYGILVSVVVICAVSIFYQYYSTQVYKENEANLIQISDNVMTQVDSRLSTLEQVAIDVMGNNTFMTAWSHWVTEKRTFADTATLRKLLVNAYKSRPDIRRVAIYDLNGAYICTGQADPTEEAVSARAAGLMENYNMNQATSRV